MGDEEGEESASASMLVLGKQVHRAQVLSHSLRSVWRGPDVDMDKLGPDGGSDHLFLSIATSLRRFPFILSTPAAPSTGSKH